MSSAARGQAKSTKSKKQSEYMKERGQRRSTGRCPICNRMAAIPMDNHIRNCKG